MLVNLTYPAFLAGRPARHRDEKPCLLVLEIEVNFAEACVDAAPVAMALDDGYSNGAIEAFDTRNEVFGSLAHEALRHYFTVRFDHNSLRASP